MQFHVPSIMKLFALLPLLVLTLLQGALTTHLETCPCDEIRELVNSTVQGAVAGLENRLSLVQEAVTGLEERLHILIHNAVDNINATDNSALEKLEKRLSANMERLIKPMQQQLDYHLPREPGNSQDHPSVSCKDVLEKYPSALSGYYWILKSGSASPVRVYCSMNLTCGSQTGAWMRVADLDMRNSSQTCPSGLSLVSSPKRLCKVTSSPTCVSSKFSVQAVQYSQVCGKIIGYQDNVPVAFHYSSRGIEGSYVHGVSVTHGQNPRKHIWTFAAASDETSRDYTHKCPCINTAITSSRVPSYIGNDYFCATALKQHYRSVSHVLQTADPLWDGNGCGPTNTCCSFNTPPWFVKDLPSPTTDNIEMRVCRPDANGPTPIETVELYVQ